MEPLNVTEQNLNEVMGIDCRPITVHENGTVTQDSTLYAPEMLLEKSTDDAVYAMARRAGWDLLSGYTGQQGYNGPVLHLSEFIGGRLSQDILETPGTYVATFVDVFDDITGNYEPMGWVVARRL